MPAELIVATFVSFTDHVTPGVMFAVVGRAEPPWPVPTAVNCAVCPTAVSTVAPASGRISIDLSVLQPASASASGSMNRQILRGAGWRGIIGKLLHPTY